MMSIFVLAVCSAILLRDAATMLEGSTDPGQILGAVAAGAPPPDAVIIAGAWRLPCGNLSRAFTNRITAGLRIALLTGSPILLLTGGNNESVAAKEFLLQMRNASSVIFSSAISAAAEEDRGDNVGMTPELLTRAHLLAEDMNHFATFGEFLESMRPPQKLSILVENRSTTTAENARFARAVLQEAHVGEATEVSLLFPELKKNSVRQETDVAASPQQVQRLWHFPGAKFIVVSSPYHLLRCRALFLKYLSVWAPPHEETGKNGWKGTQVLTYASTQDEYELSLPDEGVIYASDSLFGTDVLVPQFLARAAHTVFLTYRHWRAHLRATTMSMGWYMRLREFGAIVKGLYTGQLTLASLQQ